MPKRIIVVGSGIIGSSIAYHLAEGGARVTVLDQEEPGGVATRASWAWINASWGNPEPYFRLRMRSIAEWQLLAGKVSNLTLDWCGGLIWDLEPEALESYAAERKAWGHPLRRVSRSEILDLEPNLKQVPDNGYFAEHEGKVEPLAAAQALLGAAAAKGAEVLGNSPAKWLVEEDNRISGVMTDEGVIHADEVIVAAGAATAGLLDSIGITLKMGAPAGLLSHSKPAPKLLDRLIMTPGLHLRQTLEGRIVSGTDFAGADPEGNAEDLAADLQGKVQAMVKGAEDLELDFFTVGYRPTPADGFLAMGRPRNREGLYVAVTHSGITLAPAVGLFAAREILDDMRDPLLDLYHPDRPSLT
jgi:glycine/D-amino acid oxidase-like deaminating enzyme